MMKKSLLIVGIVLIGVLTLTACSTENAESVSTPEPIAASATIAEGRLLPLTWLDQSFVISGKVDEVNVEDGDVVGKGDTLASLQTSPDAMLALARAEEEVLAAQQALDAFKASAELNLAQAELAAINAQQAYDAAQAVFDANTSDENKAERDLASAALALARDSLTRIESADGLDPVVLAALDARLASAEAGLESARALVAASVLTSSLEGAVVDLSLQPGQLVSAGTPVMVVADTSSWIVKTDNLSETQVESVEVGDPVEIALDALPDLKLNGEVTHINGRYEEKRGDTTYTVTININELDQRMRWGMAAAVYFLP